MIILKDWLRNTKLETAVIYLSDESNIKIEIPDNKIELTSGESIPVFCSDCPEGITSLSVTFGYFPGVSSDKVSVVLEHMDNITLESYFMMPEHHRYAIDILFDNGNILPLYTTIDGILSRFDGTNYTSEFGEVITEGEFYAETSN